MNNIVKKLPDILSKIDALYISDKFIDVVSEQSCDCDELVIKNGDFYIKLTSHAINEEDGYIAFETLEYFNENTYPYEVVLTNTDFVFDRLQFISNNYVEGIRFKYKEEYLFIFALDTNLVITKSKADLFDDATDYTVYEKEATLTITRRL